VLAGVSLILYWGVGQHGFINLDDPEYITQNPHVLGGLTWENVRWAFSTGYAANWHPLTWLSHMLDVQWFGQNAGGHHLVSAFLHAANAALCFLALRGLTGALWRSAIVAALFAFHPLHVESVAWASERKDVLSAVFFFLTLRAYAAYVKGSMTTGAGPSGPKVVANSRGTLYYGLALGAFALGLMSKAMLVTVPCLLLLLDFWPLGRIELSNWKARLKPLVLEKIPFFVLSAASSIVTYMVQDQAKAVGSVESLSLEARVANAFLSTFKYLAKAIWPADLSPFYPHPYLHYPNGDPVITLAVVMAFGVVVAVSISILVRHKTQPYLVTGWFWFLGMLVPVIGLVQVGSQGMADRYTYLPLVGFFVCFVWGVADCAQDRALPWKLTATAGGAVIVACAGVAWKQVAYWRDDVSLFSHAVAVTGNNPQAHFNLATGLGKQGKYAEAITHLNKAVEIMPNYIEAQYDLGLAYMSEGKLDRAAQEYEKALHLRPGYLPARINLGTVLLGLGRPQEAFDNYAEAAKWQPGSPILAFNQGRALLALRRFDEASSHFGEAARSCPTDVDVHISFANALYEAGRTNEARQAFQETVQLDSALPQKMFAGGKALLAQDRLDLAQLQFELCQRLQPGNAVLDEQIGMLLAGQNKPNEALLWFERCLALRPDAQSHYNLGLASVMAGLWGRAATNYQAAIKLNPDWAIALNDLAWLQATAPDEHVRNGPEAVRLAERACALSQQKEARYLGTLDAAYAEAGRFDEAIAMVGKACALAQTNGQPELVQAADERLACYKRREAFRQKQN